MNRNTLFTHALTGITPERLAKATTALTEGQYSVTVGQCTPTYLSGDVRSKTQRYRVTCTMTAIGCTCPDARFHRGPCKHVAMLVLSVTRAFQEAQPYHLGDMVSDGTRTGKVIAVSGGTISVAWNTGGLSAHAQEELSHEQTLLAA